MGAFKDLRGQKFGRLRVLERAENDKRGQTRWRCLCSCGTEIVVTGGNLQRGQKSCGCLKKERTSERCLQNLVGQRFNKLVVLERAENSKSGQTRWRCRCSCGNEVVVLGGHLKSGATQSCGCLSREHAAELNKTHGMCHSKIYKTWQDIKKRCFNPSRACYKHYGGRGITMYAPWVDDFQAFYDYVSQLEHFGEDGCTLDRIDNGGSYEPGNLRWATKFEQARNKRSNIIVEYNGEQVTMAEAAELSGINYSTLMERHHRGDYERGRLFRPVRQHK